MSSRKMSSRELVEANRDKILAWADEGRSYFWMVQAIGLNERSAAAVSEWFIAQGIRRRKAAK